MATIEELKAQRTAAEQEEASFKPAVDAAQANLDAAQAQLDAYYASPDGLS